MSRTLGVFRAILIAHDVNFRTPSDIPLARPSLVSLRMFLALPQQFHDGLGFLTSHGLLSNTFEFSLQQVNPKLTLPYWDFTIESSSTGAEAAKDLDDMFGSPIKTPLLQESWFGTTDPETQIVRFLGWKDKKRLGMFTGWSQTLFDRLVTHPLRNWSAREYFDNLTRPVSNENSAAGFWP